MNIIDSILLGIIQGITEFLPVSSSGHLALIESLLGQKDVPLLYDIILHVASLIAVLIFFRGKVISLLKGIIVTRYNENHRYALMIVLSTGITGIMLFVTKPAVYFLRSNPLYLTGSFLFTAVILLIAQHFMKRTEQGKMITTADAFFIGIFQGIAVLPGVSRSGSTIASALFRKIPAEQAVEYSFMLSIPAILGALVLESGKGSFGSIDFMTAAAGFVSSFIASIIALRFLVFMIKKTVLYPFSIYLFLLACVVPFVL